MLKEESSAEVPETQTYTVTVMITGPFIHWQCFSCL